MGTLVFPGLCCVLDEPFLCIFRYDLLPDLVHHPHLLFISVVVEGVRGQHKGERDHLVSLPTKVIGVLHFLNQPLNQFVQAIFIILLSY